MPAFGSQLSKAQIQSVAKYVSSVAGKGGGGSDCRRQRPAVT